MREEIINESENDWLGGAVCLAKFHTEEDLKTTGNGNNPPIILCSGGDPYLDLNRFCYFSIGS